MCPDLEEQNLFITYKHITGTLCTSWHTVKGIEKQETTNGCVTQCEQVLICCQCEQALIHCQCKKIELKLADACKDLLNHQLVPTAEPGEKHIFYPKMHVPPLSLSCHPFLPNYVSTGVDMEQAGQLLLVSHGIRTASGA
jgi:hypothetical protein